MTPKEKAQHLVQRYIDEACQDDEVVLYTSIAKKCALIAVDERIKPEPLNGNVLARKYFLYWQEVKQEIENL